MGSEHLLLMMGLIAGMFAVTSLKRRVPSWSALSLVFLAACSAGYLLAPDRAGWWVLGPFILFMFLPALATMQVSRFVAARKYPAAQTFARIASLLHPFGANRALYDMTNAWRLASEGRLDEAELILRKESGLDRDACMLEILRLRNRWDDVVRALDGRHANDIDRGLGVLYVRALGETGDIARMLEIYGRLDAAWRKTDELDEELATARMFVAAFLGRADLVDAIAAGRLRHYDDAIKKYWRATAYACAGDRARADAIWTELAREQDWRMRAASEHRLAHPPTLHASGHEEVIATLEAALRDDATYTPRAAAGDPRAVVGYGFATVLVVVQLVVLSRGDRVTALYDLGMFWSPAVLDDGEWWRCVTAVFLHADWMHLALNVFALLWFGPFVERFLGRIHFAIVALLGGIGGFVLLALLDAADLRDPNAALGASGAVMALVGASAAIFWRGAKAQSQAAAVRLRDMLVFVGIQVVFDLAAPNVSMTGHLTGLVIGFVLGLLRARVGSR